MLIAWNLPWALFTAYALLGLALPGLGGWRCPIAHWCGWCPGCGLTGSYRDLLRGRRPSTWFIVPILVSFVLNAAWSLRRATAEGSALAPER